MKNDGNNPDGNNLNVDPSNPELGGNPSPDGGQVVPFDFSAASDGRFNSWEDVNSAFTGYESKIAELQGREYEFNSPLAKAIDGLAGKGATPDEINAFVKVQGLDLEKMSPEQLVMEHMKFTQSGLNSEDINFVFNQTYKVEFGEDDEKRNQKMRAQEIQLKKDATAAKSFFLEKQKELARPNSVRKAEEQAALINQRRDSWEKGLNISDELSFPISFKEGENEISFELKIPSNPEVRNELLNYAISRGIEPTTENIGKIAQQAARTAFAQQMEHYAEAIARDFYAKGLQAATAAGDNPASISRNNGGAPIEGNADLKAIKSKLLAKMGR